MKKRIVLLVLVGVMSCWFVGFAVAESVSGNTLYETLHIKQMAERNFTNNGRTKYVYVKPRQQFVQPILSPRKCYQKSISGNTLYDDMQRKQNKNIPPCDSIEIGAVHLDKKSKAREINIAVDLPAIGLRPLQSMAGSKKKVSIAPVYSENKFLRQTNVVVNGKITN